MSIDAAERLRYWTRIGCPVEFLDAMGAPRPSSVRCGIRDRWVRWGHVWPSSQRVHGVRPAPMDLSGRRASHADVRKAWAFPSAGPSDRLLARPAEIQRRLWFRRPPQHRSPRRSHHSRAGAREGRPHRRCVDSPRTQRPDHANRDANVRGNDPGRDHPAISRLAIKAQCCSEPDPVGSSISINLGSAIVPTTARPSTRMVE